MILTALCRILVTSTLVVAAVAPGAVGQVQQQTSTAKSPVTNVRDAKTGDDVAFPDEFSDLDERQKNTVAPRLRTSTADNVDRARQYYLQALEAVEKKRRSEAAGFFDRAIVLLNDVATNTEITATADYTELVEAIVEDYETYITDIDDIRADAPISVLRRRMFAEVDAKPTVAPLKKPTTTASAKTPWKAPSMGTTQIEMTQNEYVDRSLQFIASEKGQKFFNQCLERSSRWFPILKRIAAEEQMPPEIIFLAIMESGLNPYAVSRAEAVGMWQFIASTGKMYNLKIDTWVDERRDIEKSTRASMRFLKDLYEDLGDWHLALAAYNCGPGGVRRAQRRSGVQGGKFWEIREQLPKETRNYVPFYIATSMVAMDPEKYGFDLSKLNFHPEYIFDTVAVEEPTNLTALAKCASISIDSLKKLNPELRRSCTPPDARYALKIPVGKRTEFKQQYALLTEDEKLPWIEHTVGRRETLAKVAQRYGVSATDLAALNNISGYRRNVRRGQVLRVPVVNRGAVDFADDASTASLASNTSASSTTASQPAAATARETKKHTVQRGENLATIAKRYGVEIADLRAWNDLNARRETIHPGQELVVNVSARPEAAPSVERIAVTKVSRHKVRRGETVSSIADRYGMSVQRLRSLNGLSRRAALKAGRTIKVETTTASFASSRSDDRDTKESASKRKSKQKTYRVQRGDTLSTIASKFGMSISQLRKANPSLRNSDDIRAGQQIRLQ